MHLKGKMGIFFPELKQTKLNLKYHKILIQFIIFQFHDLNLK